MHICMHCLSFICYLLLSQPVRPLTAINQSQVSQTDLIHYWYLLSVGLLHFPFLSFLIFCYLSSTVVLHFHFLSCSIFWYFYPLSSFDYTFSHLLSLFPLYFLFFKFTFTFFFNKIRAMWARTATSITVLRCPNSCICLNYKQYLSIKLQTVFV